MNAKMIPVVSSTIHRIGYDEETRTLYIDFYKSGIYEYTNVPKVLYDDFLNAPSKGHYFQVYIKETIKGHKVSP